MSPRHRQWSATKRKRFRNFSGSSVVPTYSRFDLVLKRGEGSYVWDVNGKRYLDLGGGIAVCALGHAHPELTQALVEQSRQLGHVSNLYYHEAQGRLAHELARRIGPGKVFFCNSGAEANEGLYKLARRFGNDEGRFEILTAQNSFHGRTLAGIAASGQAKVKKGFGPMVPGFRQIPFNDLAAARAALSPATAAILVEGVQGEIGVVPAEADYLLGLRQLCDEKRLLLLMDGVQCGHYRTGRFQSFQRILEEKRAEADWISARRGCHGQISRRRFSDGGFLGAGGPRGFAERRIARHHLWRLAAGLRGGAEDSGDHRARPFGRATRGRRAPGSKRNCCASPRNIRPSSTKCAGLA